MSARLDEIEARAAAATDGPWSRPSRAALVYGSSIYGNHGEDLVAETWECEECIDDPAPDAAFIAAARQDVPWLLKEVRKRDAALRAVLAIPQDGPGRADAWDKGFRSAVRMAHRAINAALDAS